MNALVKKEIRLLLPSWLAVLTLVFLLPWLWKNPDEAFGRTPFFMFFGTILLAVASFGREFSSGTFQSLLSQPIERRQIWRTKIAILFCAATLIFAAYFASCALLFHQAFHIPIWSVNSKIIQSDFWNAMVGGGAAVLVALAGGLWTTLLLRQITAAFWITFLTPAALLTLIALVMSKFFNSASNVVVYSVLYGAAGFYIASAFWLAHRLFMRAQDVAWTGGTITLPEMRWLKWWGKRLSGRSQAKADPREPQTASDIGSSVASPRQIWRPRAALFWKELQLHQVSLLCAAGLLVMHFGVIVLRKVVEHPSFEEHVALEGFWLLWLAMPVIIGSMAVAEEHKLGTMESQLCLPVSGRVQFVIKLFFVLIFGGLLSGALLWTAERFGVLIGAKAFFSGTEKLSDPATIVGISATFLALSMIAFFASTLSRNILQALSTAIATIIVFFFIMVVAEVTAYRPNFFFGMTLWQGSLVFLITIPVLVITFLWLAYQNFKTLHENWRVWRRNILGLMGALVFSGALTTSIYNRAWEFLTPFEPVHGAARLTVSQSPISRTSYDGIQAILFPDGRLWLSRLLWRVENDGSTEEPVGLTGNHFVSGSNWVDAATSYRAIIGIQSNGSLWYAETEGKFIVVGWNKPLVQSQKPIEMTRFGNETNWQSVSREGNFPLLLKKDGTLWLWGTNHFDSWQNSWRDKWPGLHTFQPYRFATESNWTEMFSTYDDIYLRTSDGHVWTLLRGAPYKQTNSHEIASGVWVMRNSWETNLDRIKWRSLAKGYSDFGLGVREDGTLWIYGNLRRKRISPSNSELLGFEMRQIGKETNWMSVTWDSVTPVALKFDGSLWKLKKSDWLQKTHPNEVIINTITTLVRAGNHSDWIAVQHLWNGILALAADGSLWYWQTGPLYLENYHHLPRFMLAAPRKPALIGNIFDKSG